VYGYAPDPPRVDVDRREVGAVLDGRATLTELTIRFADLPDDAPAIDLALFTPAERDSAPSSSG